MFYEGVHEMGTRNPLFFLSTKLKDKADRIADKRAGSKQCVVPFFCQKIAAK